MNVDEILSHQPVGSIDEAEQNERKLGNSKLINNLLNSQNDSKSKQQYNYLDDNWIKKMILQFERKLAKNQEQRIKYANEPTNFLNSEIELFDILQEMHAFPAVPESYNVLIDHKVFSSLIGLLEHENTDIVVSVINLLFEFSENEADSENLENEQLVLQALIDAQTIKCIISAIQRLDENETEERSAIDNALSIIESLSDYDPDVLKDCNQLVTWIIQRLKSKTFNENKLSACELLSILLQTDEANKKLIGEQNGIDTLLQQIATYKKNCPESVSEQEYIENLFNCICSSLLDCKENKQRFFDGEGIELMNIILRDKNKKGKKAMRFGALKVLSYLFVNDKQDDELLIACSDRFVEILGLRGVFPVFMVPKSVVSSKKKFKNDEDIDKAEEYVLLVILTILKYAKKSNKQRCLYKFEENNNEKLERLVELYFKYSTKMIKCDQQINKEKTKLLADDQTIDEEQFLFKRLSNGLLTLQIISQLIVIICSSDSHKLLEELGLELKDDLKSRFLKQINMRSSHHDHIKYIKKFVQEVIDSLEDDDKQKENLKYYLDKF